MRKKVAAAPKVVPMPDDKAFGLRLQEIRKRRGFSQVDVAERLGIHPSLISQFERGYLRLHGALLVRFAQMLATTPDEIPARRPRPTTAMASIDASCGAAGKSTGCPTTTRGSSSARSTPSWPRSPEAR
jgi:DNA-binding XRE family transcriptional regulator